MSKLVLKNISKTYEDGTKSVRNIDLDALENEFLVLVGPSGSGKSTTLRMIAGLEDIDCGEIILNDKIINNMLPKNRDIAMVFQNYALYPHLTVYENMAFSLKLKKINKKEIDTKIKKIAENLEITDILEKKPSKLSGGQKQRVALGRAIVREPQVFLMDEPLSNLDAKLRLQMRTEIIKLHKKLNTTFIYVTHDQVEAMTMGNRIAVMNNGKIMQIDTPQNIYQTPQNLFVAKFIGTPKINTFMVDINDNFIENKDKKITINLNDIKNKEKLKNKNNITLAFRPEDIILNTKNFDFKAEIEVIENLGSEKYIFLDNSITLKIPSYIDLKENSEIKVKINRENLHFFDENENRI